MLSNESLKEYPDETLQLPYLGRDHGEKNYMLTAIKKNILIFLGSLFLILGFIGIFLPILPTTPFLLLTVYCYIRSSKRLYNWVMSNKLFGPYIYNYMHYKAVLKSTKIATFTALWLGLGISMAVIKTWWIVVLLAVAGIGVSIHVLSLKTIDKSKIEKFDPNKNQHI